MSHGAGDEAEADHGEVFLDESDILHEIAVDDEELPDADDEAESDSEAIDAPDDSMHIFTGHTGELYTVACSLTNGALVATGGGDDKGFMWKIGHGDWACELQGIVSACKLGASIYDARQVCLAYVAAPVLPVLPDFQHFKTCTGHKDSVSSVAFSADGQLLASGGFDGIVQIWDTVSGNLKCTLDGPGGGIEWVKWHPKGHLILAGSEDSTVWMWNADKAAYLNMFSGHASTVTCGDFTPDGKTICTGSDDASLRIWNPKTGGNIHVVSGHPYHTEGLTCLTITSDSTLALTGSKDNTVHIVNITTGKVVSSLNAHTDSIECIELSVSSPWAATGSMDQKLIVWDLQHSLPRCTCEHEEGVACLSWLGSSKYVATGCVDGKIRIWDSLSGDCIRIFSGHSDAIQSIVVSSDGKYIVSVSLDGTARVFEIGEFK